ncbi:MAG: hypothetical protein Q8L02_03075 [Candidatus Nitrotoga sp.]|nr:hypothetical protein [Candidatus Nitrotoga sp.]
MQLFETGITVHPGSGNADQARTLGLEAASGLMSYGVPDIQAMCVAAVRDPAVRGISASRDNQ